jgi:hypothetical protein
MAMTNSHRSLVGRSEGKRSLSRTKRKWDDNIKIDLEEIEYEG